MNTHTHTCVMHVLHIFAACNFQMPLKVIKLLSRKQEHFILFLKTYALHIDILFKRIIALLLHCVT